MTLEELRAAHPELVAQAEQQAVTAAVADAVADERKRLSDIDDIATSVGDATLVNDAKYGGNPCTAQELAFRSLKKNASLGKAHLENSQADYTASGTGSVGAAPTGSDDGEETPEKVQAHAENAMKNYSKMMGGGKGE